MGDWLGQIIQFCLELEGFVVPDFSPWAGPCPPFLSSVCQGVEQLVCQGVEQLVVPAESGPVFTVV